MIIIYTIYELYSCTYIGCHATAVDTTRLADMNYNYASFHLT